MISRRELLAAAAIPFAPKARGVEGAPEGRVARVGRINGVATPIVDDRPFLILGAQCDIWRSTHQDEKTIAFFDGFRDMNATAVSVGIPWSKIEPQKDTYDFRFVDWFVDQAERRGLKLVLNLFNTNVCGKVCEGSGSSIYPAYTPSYIVDHPETYRRMVLPYPYKYVEQGPPMCPNDPGTLDRECRLVTRIAQHLKETDSRRTVIMLQLDNEFYYQQWDGKRPAYGSDEERAVRCQCPNCLTKWASGVYASGEEFMFRSFADYVRGLTEAITFVYPLPLYINSPWWPPRVIPFFLERCPNLALVGIDGIMAPQEPNILSQSQVGRNIPFAAENPTESAATRLNLDVLPYYTAVGRPGIGNLLWECHPPNTVVEDPTARRRYGDALYPLKHALEPICLARGTERLLGWYELRNIRSGLATDAFGNYVPSKPDESPVESSRMFVREGATTRTETQSRFSGRVGPLAVEVSGSHAGVAALTGPHILVLALPSGHVTVHGIREVHAEVGRFDGMNWNPDGPAPITPQSDAVVVETARPVVIRLTFQRAI
jgi:hypothetical protein